MELNLNKFKVRKVTYKNGILLKFDNRRIFVGTCDDGYYFMFKRLDEGKIRRVDITLSPEAAEAVMFSLAELMGCKITKPK